MCRGSSTCSTLFLSCFLLFKPPWFVLETFSTYFTTIVPLRCSTNWNWSCVNSRCSVPPLSANSFRLGIATYKSHYSDNLCPKRLYSTFPFHHQRSLHLLLHLGFGRPAVLSASHRAFLEVALTHLNETSLTLDVAPVSFNLNDKTDYTRLCDGIRLHLFSLLLGQICSTNN